MSGFACTDIRFRKKDGGKSDSVEKPISEQEALIADKKEVKRLERKRKKQGKLSKKENIALDCLYTKRILKKKSAKDTSEDEASTIEASEKNFFQDGFDDHK